MLLAQQRCEPYDDFWLNYPCVNPHKFPRWLKLAVQSDSGNAVEMLLSAFALRKAQRFFQVEKRQEKPMTLGKFLHQFELKLSCCCSSRYIYIFLKTNKHVFFFWTAFTFWTWRVVVFVGVDSWKNIGESKRLFFVQTPQSEFRQRQGLVTVVQGSLLGSVLSNLLLAWISQFFFQEEVGGKVWMDRESLFLCLCFVLCVCVFCGVCCLFFWISALTPTKRWWDWHLRWNSSYQSIPKDWMNWMRVLHIQATSQLL